MLIEKYLLPIWSNGHDVFRTDENLFKLELGTNPINSNNDLCKHLHIFYNFWSVISQ